MSPNLARLLIASSNMAKQQFFTVCIRSSCFILPNGTCRIYGNYCRLTVTCAYLKVTKFRGRLIFNCPRIRNVVGLSLNDTNQLFLYFFYHVTSMQRKPFSLFAFTLSSVREGKKTPQRFLSLGIYINISIYKKYGINRLKFPTFRIL